MTKLPLIRGVDLVVFDGDADRFVRLFREAWFAIPAADRRRIRRHWRSHQFVWIELTDYWSGWSPGTEGNAELLGSKVKFCAPYVDRMSDDGVRFIVAHELAHVLQWADGRMGAINKTEAERDANARALAWLGLTRRPGRTRALRAYHLQELLEHVKELQKTRREACRP